MKNATIPIIKGGLSSIKGRLKLYKSKLIAFSLNEGSLSNKEGASFDAGTNTKEPPAITEINTIISFQPSGEITGSYFELT